MDDSVIQWENLQVKIWNRDDSALRNSRQQIGCNAPCCHAKPLDGVGQKPHVGIGVRLRDLAQTLLDIW